MKSINLQLEELGPWMKFNTPPVTPFRKIMPISITNRHKRAVTSIVQDKGINEEYINLNQEHSLSKYLQEHAITHLPAIDIINKISLGHDIKNNRKHDDKFETNRNIMKKEYFELYNDIKSSNISEINNNLEEIDYESHHINHQYFPYRKSGFHFRLRIQEKKNSKNVFTYKLKQPKNSSFSSSTPKNYIFWNQRKLESIGNRKKNQSIG